MSDLFGNPEDRFSRVAAQIIPGAHYETMPYNIQIFFSCKNLKFQSKSFVISLPTIDVLEQKEENVIPL